MRRMTQVLMAMLVAMALVVEGMGSVSSAQEAGEPVGPKDWAGEVTISIWTSSLTEFWFFQAGCDWAGQDDLNGFDTLIWDVAGYESLPVQVTWTAESGDLGYLHLSYFTSDCEKIIGIGEILDDMDKRYDILLPALAKWMVLRPQAPTGGMYGVTVEMHSDGTPAETPDKKKKKKKKR